MVGDGEALGLGHRVLALFDFGVIKLFDLAAVQTYQMVVVLSLIEFINGLAALKMAADQNAGLLELGQDAVHRSQSHVGALFQQQAVDVLGRHMAVLAALKHLQDLQARQGGLESGVFEFVDVGHGVW